MGCAEVGVIAVEAAVVRAELPWNHFSDEYNWSTLGKFLSQGFEFNMNKQ